MRAIVLSSGGLDSTTVIALAKNEGFEVEALSCDYGQKHKKELHSATRVAKHYKIPHWTIHLDALSLWGGSALTDDDVHLHYDRSLDEMVQGVPTSYVPARNTILIANALSLAETVDADAIFVGVNALDYSGYPDCRPDYIQEWQRLINLATFKTVNGENITLRAPLIDLDKAQIVQLGLQADAPYHLTWSCYEGGELACGRCDSCILRLKGFADNGLRDPIEYESGIYQ